MECGGHRGPLTQFLDCGGVQHELVHAPFDEEVLLLARAERDDGSL